MSEFYKISVSQYNRSAANTKNRNQGRGPCPSKSKPKKSSTPKIVVGIPHAHVSKAPTNDVAPNVTLTKDVTKATAEISQDAVATGITNATVALTNTVAMTKAVTTVVVMTSEDGMPVLWKSSQGLAPGSAHACVNVRDANAHLRGIDDPRDMKI